MGDEMKDFAPVEGIVRQEYIYRYLSNGPPVSPLKEKETIGHLGGEGQRR